MKKALTSALIALAACATPVAAQTKLDFILNWVPGGNPAGDGARSVRPALAKQNGLDTKSVIWVNIDANSKLAALKSKAVDATTSFYNLHHVFQRELGDDMGFLAWRDAGLNTYGNSV